MLGFAETSFAKFIRGFNAPPMPFHSGLSVQVWQRAKTIESSLVTFRSVGLCFVMSSFALPSLFARGKTLAHAVPSGLIKCNSWWWQKILFRWVLLSQVMFSRVTSGWVESGHAYLFKQIMIALLVEFCRESSWLDWLCLVKSRGLNCPVTLSLVVQSVQFR